MFKDKNMGNQAIMGGFAACALAEVLSMLIYFFYMIFSGALYWGLSRFVFWLGAWMFILGMLAIAGGYGIRFLAGQDILDAAAAGCAGLYGLLALIHRFALYPAWLSKWGMGLLLLGLFAVIAFRAMKKSDMQWCAMSAAAGLWLAFLASLVQGWFMPSNPLKSSYHFFAGLVTLIFGITIVAAWGVGLLAAKETND